MFWIKYALRSGGQWVDLLKIFLAANEGFDSAEVRSHHYATWRLTNDEKLDGTVCPLSTAGLKNVV